MTYVLVTVVSLLLVFLAIGATVGLITLWSGLRSYKSMAEKIQQEALILSAELSERDIHLQAVNKALDAERNAFKEFATKPVVAVLNNEQFQYLIKEIKAGVKAEKEKELLN
jgi:hypothetical protein